MRKPRGHEEADCLFDRIVEVIERQHDGHSEITEGTPKTRFTAPGVTPASANARTNAATDAGVSSGPLRIIEHPAARDALILRTD
jgi:hypothetical protein